MNEVEFRNWLAKSDIKKKLVGDVISRLKRVEKELICDLDEQYNIDQCERVMRLFLNNGINDEMKAYQNVKLPLGKYYMSTYRHSIKKYIQFKNNFDVE